jgi:PIN domain nuclease of toxin-antitoxin system
VILIDTHVLVWLYTGLVERIPTLVQERLNREQLALSPIAQLELAYMCQIGRIRDPIATVVDDLTARFEIVVADVSAAALCRAAIGLTWTRDPFDRLLAAHATVANLPLVTKDATLRQHLPLAWWAE